MKDKVNIYACYKIHIGCTLNVMTEYANVTGIKDERQQTVGKHKERWFIV